MGPVRSREKGRESFFFPFGHMAAMRGLSYVLQQACTLERSYI